MKIQINTVTDCCKYTGTMHQKDPDNTTAAQGLQGERQVEQLDVCRCSVFLMHFLILHRLCIFAACLLSLYWFGFLQHVSVVVVSDFHMWFWTGRLQGTNKKHVFPLTSVTSTSSFLTNVSAVSLVCVVCDTTSPSFCLSYLFLSRSHLHRLVFPRWLVFNDLLTSPPLFILFPFISPHLIYLLPLFNTFFLSYSSPSPLFLCSPSFLSLICN